MDFQRQFFVQKTMRYLTESSFLFHSIAWLSMKFSWGSLHRFRVNIFVTLLVELRFSFHFLNQMVTMFSE